MTRCATFIQFQFARDCAVREMRWSVLIGMRPERRLTRAQVDKCNDGSCKLPQAAAVFESDCIFALTNVDRQVASRLLLCGTTPNSVCGCKLKERFLTVNKNIEPGQVEITIRKFHFDESNELLMCDRLATFPSRPDCKRHKIILFAQLSRTAPVGRPDVFHDEPVLPDAAAFSASSVSSKRIKNNSFDS